MNYFDFIFNDNEYNKLKNEYDKLLSNNTDNCLAKLNNLIKLLEINSFDMPIDLQNSVLDLLLQAQNILKIINTESKPNKIPSPQSTNIFTLIKQLCELSVELNSHTLKSAYQIICLKSNNFILNAINKISAYFENKKLKIFKFI